MLEKVIEAIDLYFSKRDKVSDFTLLMSPKAYDKLDEDIRKCKSKKLLNRYEFYKPYSLLIVDVLIPEEDFHIASRMYASEFERWRNELECL